MATVTTYTIGLDTDRATLPARGAAVVTLDGTPATVTGFFLSGRGLGVIVWTASGAARLTRWAVAS